MAVPSISSRPSPTSAVAGSYSGRSGASTRAVPAADTPAARVTMSAMALRLAAAVDDPGPTAHTSAPLIVGPGPDADQRFVDSSGGVRMGGGPTIDPRIPSISKLLEDTFAVPVRITQTRSGPPGLLALDPAGDLFMELDTIDRDGLPNPGAFKARAVVQMENGKAKSLDLVVELQGTFVTVQRYELPEEPNHLPASLRQLGKAFAAVNNDGFALELVECGRDPP